MDTLETYYEITDEEENSYVEAQIGETLSEIYYELGDIEEETLNILSTENIETLEEEELHQHLKTLENLIQLGFYEDIVTFIKGSPASIRELLARDTAIIRALAAKGQIETAVELATIGYTKDKTLNKRNWNTNRDITETLKMFIAEDIPPEIFFSLYNNGRKILDKSDSNEITEVLSISLSNYKEKIKETPELKESLWEYVKKDYLQNPVLLAEWGNQFGECSKNFELLMGKIQYTEKYQKQLLGTHLKALIQICSFEKNNENLVTQLAGYLNEKFDLINNNSKNTSIVKETTSLLETDSYNEETKITNNIEILEEITTMLSLLKETYPKTLEKILSGDTYDKILQLEDNLKEYGLVELGEDRHFLIQEQTLQIRENIKIALGIKERERNYNRPTFKEIYEEKFINELQDIWKNIKEFPLKSITKETRPTLEKLSNIFNNKEPWVQKFLCLTIEKNGMFSNHFVNFFMLPSEEEERYIPIKKTGSPLEISMEGSSKGLLYRTLNTTSADAWEETAQKLAYSEKGIIIGTEPYQETETDTEINPNKKIIHSRFCGYTLRDIQLLLSEVPEKEVDILQDQLIEVIEGAILKVINLGINHGHPHIDNFTIEFWPKNKPMQLEDLNTLTNKETYIQDPREWYKNKNDYIIVCRLIDFDRATKSNK